MAVTLWGRDESRSSSLGCPAGCQNRWPLFLQGLRLALLQCGSSLSKRAGAAGLLKRAAQTGPSVTAASFCGKSKSWGQYTFKGGREIDSPPDGGADPQRDEGIFVAILQHLFLTSISNSISFILQLFMENSPYAGLYTMHHVNTSLGACLPAGF